MQRVSPRTLLLIVFTLSGFAGLIYESIWSHYLKLFLGHAAYAQTLVLGIFMGGMAVGSWISSRGSSRWRNLLLAYAIVEGVIGLFGVAFHGVFVRAIEAAYTSVLPNLGSPILANGFKWTLGIVLILPQSILLGMTFPLMSAGLIRRFPASPGASLAMLYFTNSIGAAIGVLVSGFVLITEVGLPGTVLTAGLINVALALVVWGFVKYQPSETVPIEQGRATPSTSSGWYHLLLGVALVTGMSSFMYEIGWLRMLALVLGASTHAFELMLSAFILGLALGGLWVRRRIDTTSNPVRLLAIVQIAMGVCALLSLVLYGHTFEGMRWLLQALNRSDGGYLVFNLSSHAIAMAVMLPATFCAGMTLPLITFALLHSGYGEKSIGAVYAANTVGAILGILIAIHIAMPLLNLKWLLTLGAGLDILLGLALIWGAVPHAETKRPRPQLAVTAVGVIAIAGTISFVDLDNMKLASGVFRTGSILGDDARVLYHQDGKTASVDLVLQESTLMIRTNGKTDASIELDLRKPAAHDEATMILSAAIPMLYHPKAKTVAVIGLGSGLTSQTFLANPTIAQVDTIEIEPAMIEGAQGFRPLTERVYTDPRARLHIEDAKSFLSVHNRKYDIIMSEPSNPWVSGVASLFTDEFYRQIRRYLHDDGVLVQWLQLYEIDVGLLSSVMKALSKHFADYVVYTPNGLDLVVLAKKAGAIGQPDYGVLTVPGLREALARIEIHHAQDMALRSIGHKKTLQGLFAAIRTPVNSDYFPFLDQNAPRTRFLQSNALELVSLTHATLPLREMLGEPTSASRRSTDVTPNPMLPQAQAAAAAAALRDFFTLGTFGDKLAALPPPLRRDAELLRAVLPDCANLTRYTQWSDSLFSVAVAMTPNLTAQELERVWASIGIDRCASRLTSSQRSWLALFKAAGRRDAVEMAQKAEILLTDSKSLRDDQNYYLLAAGVLGHLAANEKSQARLFSERHAKRVLAGRHPGLIFQTLAAHMVDDAPAVSRAARAP